MHVLHLQYAVRFKLFHVESRNFGVITCTGIQPLVAGNSSIIAAVYLYLESVVGDVLEWQGRLFAEAHTGKSVECDGERALVGSYNIYNIWQ